jgi:hypothetical protein
MDFHSTGWWAGVVVLIGGILVSHYRVLNTSGPRERSFVVVAVATFWLFVLVCLAGMALVPAGYEYPLWASYAGLLLLGTRAWNRHQDRIREEESRGRREEMLHCSVAGSTPSGDVTVVRPRPGAGTEGLTAGTNGHHS